MRWVEPVSECQGPMGEKSGQRAASAVSVSQDGCIVTSLWCFPEC